MLSVSPDGSMANRPFPRKPYTFILFSQDDLVGQGPEISIFFSWALCWWWFFLAEYLRSYCFQSQWHWCFFWGSINILLGAYEAHPCIAEHLVWPLPSKWLFSRNLSNSLWTWQSIECHKCSMGSPFVSLYSLFADTKTPPEGMHIACGSWFCPAWSSHSMSFGRSQQDLFPGEGVNIKIKGLLLSSSRCIELDPLLSTNFCIWMCSP